METAPIVAITLGDPAGIGPEVVVKALRRPEVASACRPLVVGDPRFLDASRTGTAAPPLRIVRDAAEARFEAGEVDVLELAGVPPRSVVVGQVGAAGGRAAVEAVRRAVRLALAGQVAALATAPLNKRAMRQAGYAYLGHTELLAEATGTPRCTTLLATPGLRVSHVTRHLPLREVAAALTVERVLETILLTDEGLRGLGVASPHLAVAGLNPHNGDDGLLGREEIEVIGPAVVAARARGVEARGPLSPDSVFSAAIAGAFDAVVCMYHDQGHIAVKTHDLARSITVTLGLPVVRTSADHGTALDIAGKGVADERSMAAAIVEAARLAARRPPPPPARP